MPDAAERGTDMAGQKVTIYDVANELGISTATVNRVLNNKPNVSDKMRKMVMDAVERTGYRPSRTAAALKRAPVHVKLIALVNIPEYSDVVLQGSEKAFAELEDFNFYGEIIRLNSKISYRDYIDTLYRCAEEGVNGLLLHGPYEDNVIKGAMEDIAKKYGIKFCVAQSAIPTPCNLLNIQVNGYADGKVAAELLESFLQPGEKVAMVTENCIYSEHRASLKGFREQIEQGNLTYVGVYEHKDEPELAEWLAEKIVSDIPDIKGIFLSTANSVSFCRKIEELGYGGKIKIVATDIFPALSELMERHTVQATIYKSPELLGELLVKSMYSYLMEGQTFESNTMLINPRILLNSNKQLTHNYQMGKENPKHSVN